MVVVARIGTAHAFFSVYLSKLKQCAKCINTANPHAAESGWERIGQTWPPHPTDMIFQEKYYYSCAGVRTAQGLAREASACVCVASRPR